MGKYSLENYEKYKTYKIRPQPMQTPPKNFGRGGVSILNLPWEELEPERGRFTLQPVEQALETAENPVLVIEPVPPKWAKEFPGTFYAGLIRKVGSVYDGDPRLLGVAVRTVGNAPEELDAFLCAFQKTKRLVDLSNRTAVRYFQSQSAGFGLMINCNLENWIECGELLAEQNLQNVWKHNPVLLRLPEEKSERLMRQVAFWHAAFGSPDWNLGFNFSLRRLTYPKQVTDQGALPLRFWFVNTGTAPFYSETCLKLRFTSENSYFTVPLQPETELWYPGDRMHNEIVKLPEMPLGQYRVSVGLFTKDGRPVNLDISNPRAEGFYEVGTIEVDSQPRDELFTIWDTYYPEGYYPLEDPQAPNES